MINKFRNNILKVISFVPGLVGLSDLKLVTSKPLNQKNIANGISLEETPEGFYIRIGAIVDSYVKAKIVTKEITSAIMAASKNFEYKVKKVIVYIKGVK